MKVYIAGAISNDPNYREKFERYELGEKAAGNIVLNPAALPGGMTQADYMRICFAMLDCADEVHFIPDWKESDGARLEWDYCQKVGKVKREYDPPKATSFLDLDEDGFPW